MSRARIGVALTLAGLLGSGQAAGAERSPSIGVLDVRAPDPLLTPDAPAAREALARGLSQFRVRVVEDAAAVRAAHSAGTGVEIARGLGAAHAVATEARMLFEQQDPASAEAKFREAVKLFEANAAGLDRPDDLVDAYLYLARIFFATQREPLVRDVFRRVVQLVPERALDHRVYPSGFLKIYADVKFQVLANPQGSLEVVSVPAPAKVFLDGRERGVTPLTLVNIPPGVHALAVKRTGFAPFFRPVDVTSFRVDTIRAELVTDRHPDLELAMVPKGEEVVDSLGLSLSDYLDSVASAAGLDVVVVGDLVKKGSETKIRARAYRPLDRSWRPVESIAFTGRPPERLDHLAEKVLLSAVRAGWIPPLSARRTPAAGGGALDSSVPYGLRVSGGAAALVAGSSPQFPSGPAAGVRLGFDVRLRARLVLGVESGLEGSAERRMVLSDEEGAVVTTRQSSVTGVHTSVPLDLGVRWYLGISEWAPYVSAAAGIRYDRLSLEEPLRCDRFTPSAGLGYGARAGMGLEHAVGPRSGFFLEARLQADHVGVEDVTLHTCNYPDRRIQVAPGTLVRSQIAAGYLVIF